MIKAVTLFSCFTRRLTSFAKSSTRLLSDWKVCSANQAEEYCRKKLLKKKHFYGKYTEMRFHFHHKTFPFKFFLSFSPKKEIFKIYLCVKRKPIISLFRELEFFGKRRVSVTCHVDAKFKTFGLNVLEVNDWLLHLCSHTSAFLLLRFTTFNKNWNCCFMSREYLPCGKKLNLLSWVIFIRGIFIGVVCCVLCFAVGSKNCSSPLWLNSLIG